ncbi:MAG: SlyX family protein [Succinivibrio sp.]
MKSDENVTKLEEKIAWLEDQLDKMGDELDSVYSRLEKLERQFKLLYSKVGDPFATRSQKDEVPPPHY